MTVEGSAAAAAKKYIAFVVYPELTPLDLIGPLQVLRNLGEGFQAITLGARVAPIPTEAGFSITPEATFADIEKPYAILVPGGGRGTIAAMADADVQGFLLRMQSRPST